VDDHTFVFVGGLHRSGTSVLSRCLAEHPLISGFAGTGVPEDEGQHLQSVYPTALAHGGAGRFGFDPGSRLTEASPLAADANAARLFGQWCGHWDLSRPFLLEKSPPNLVRTRFLQQLFPQSRFIMVIRDPIVVAGATRKWSHTSEISLVEHWLACYEQLLKDAPLVNELVLIRYEELTADPERVLSGLIDWLGLDPPAGVGAAVRPSLNQPYFEAWERRRSAWWRRRAYDRGIARLEARVRRFGYSLSTPGAPVGAATHFPVGQGWKMLPSSSSVILSAEKP
jgi:hypothetical protein